MGVRESLCSCSFLFLLAPAVIFWGVCVLVTTLGTLAITTSFFVAFPFGAPLWTGSLFVILGVFMLAVFRPRDQPLVMPSKAEVFFTLLTTIVAAVEVLLAVGVSIWYIEATHPALKKCSPTNPMERTDNGLYTCECSEGFINPPSLVRTVYTFKGVPDCDLIGSDLVALRHILLGFYCLGTVVCAVLVVALCKKLHSIGFCGNSGIYLVTTPEVRSVPTPVSTVSRQPSFGSSHPSGVWHTTSVTQRFPSSSQFTNDHSSTVHPTRPPSSHAMI